MKQTLSSSTTFFLKSIFSGMFLSCSAWLIANAAVEIIRSPYDLSLSATAFIVIWSGATTLFCYHLTIPLKRVTVDDRYLYASNYLKEIAIPLSEIADIRHWRIFNVQPVVIQLSSSGAFGDTIKFVPKTEFGWWWKEHSVVSELKSLVDVQHGKALCSGGLEPVNMIAVGKFKKVIPSNESDTIYDTASLQFEIIRIETAYKVR